VTEIQQVPLRQEAKNRSVKDIAAFCQKLISCMNLDLTTECREEDGIIYLDLKGPDRPILLSNSALLLNNIEYLLNKAFPGSREESPGIILDSDKYRQHRELELKNRSACSRWFLVKEELFTWLLLILKEFAARAKAKAKPAVSQYSRHKIRDLILGLFTAF